MNWEAVARGEHPDDRAFAALSPDERTRELDAALGMADEGRDPAGAAALARAVLHLLAAHDVADARIGVSATTKLANAVLFGGDTEEAERLFRHVLDQPDVEDQCRITTLVNLGNLLLRRESHEALPLLRRAFADARRLRDPRLTTSAALNLGAILRRKKLPEEAARVYEQAIEVGTAQIEDAGRDTLGSLHGNLANVLTDDLGRHREAAAHYEEAIRLFAPDNLAKIAKHRAFLFTTRLRLGEHAEALAVLDVLAPCAEDEAGSFGYALRELIVMDLPEAVQARCAEALTRTLGSVGAGAVVRMDVLAALLCLRASLGDAKEVVRLLETEDVERLVESRLGRALGAWIREIAAACNGVGRPGLLWRVADTLGFEDDGLRAGLKRAHTAEAATRRVKDLAEAVARGETSHAGAVSLLADFPGIASVPEQAPAWLGLKESGTLAAFAALRADASPPQDGVAREADAAVAVAFGAEKRHDMRAAVDAYRRVLKIVDRLGEPRQRAGFRCNLANAIVRQPGGITPARYAEAMDLLDEARTIARGLPGAESQILNNLGRLLKEAKIGDEVTRLDRAVAALESAVDLNRKHKRHDKLPGALVNLANALAEHPNAAAESVERADGLLREAQSLLEAEGPANDDPTDPAGGVLQARGIVFNSRGAVLKRLADLTGKKQDAERALECFEQALVLREQGGDADRVLLTLANVVGVELKLGRLTPARIDEHAQKARKWRARNANPLLLAGLLSNLALARKDAGDEGALSLAAESVAVAEPVGATHELIVAAKNAARVALRFGRAGDARAYAEKGILALEAFRSTGGSSSYRASLTADFESLYRDGIDALRRMGAPAADIWWIAERGAARTMIENMRRRRIEVPASASDLLGALAALDPRTVVVQVFRASLDDVGALALHAGDGKVDLSPAVVHAPIRALAEASGGFLKDGRLGWPRLDARLPTLGQLHRWLGEHLLSPVLEPHLDRTDRVVVVASGLLHDLAWSAAELPGRGELGQTVDVLALPCCAALARLLHEPRPVPRKAVLIACDPRRLLVEHVTEVRRAFSALRGCVTRVLTDEARPLSRESVLDEIGDADYVHFAGHGAFEDGAPERTGLVLSDGILSVPRIEDAFAKHAPSLVVLSACDTARSDFGFVDVPNLMTAFLQAGARSVIGSLWPLPDEVGAATMAMFYQRLATAGPAAALNATRRALVASSDPETSAHARGFVVVGWD